MIYAVESEESQRGVADPPPRWVILNDYCEWTPTDNEDYETVIVPAFQGMQLEDDRVEEAGTGEYAWNEEDSDGACSKPGKNTEIFVYKDSSSEKYSDSLIINEECYWVAPPDEEYKLTIHQELYRYPGFLRDENGNPISTAGGNIYIDKDRTKFYGDGIDVEGHLDIRDFTYSQLPNANAGLPVDQGGRYPYILGAENDNGDRYWDVNPAYYAAADPYEKHTKSVTFKYADVANLNLCGCIYILVHYLA